MPKAYLTEQDRLNARLTAWVYGQMKLNKVTQRDLAEELGVSQPAVSWKLNNHSYDFTDICCFVRVFKPDAQELNRLLGGEV